MLKNCCSRYGIVADNIHVLLTLSPVLQNAPDPHQFPLCIETKKQSFLLLLPYHLCLLLNFEVLFFAQFVWKSVLTLHPLDFCYTAFHPRAIDNISVCTVRGTAPFDVVLLECICGRCSDISHNKYLYVFC